MQIEERKTNNCYTFKETLFSIAIMFTMTAVTLLVERKEYYKDYFVKFLLFELLAVIVLTALLYFTPGISRTIKIDYFAVFFWAAFTLYTLASDILVNKQYRFAGISIFATLLLMACVIRARNCYSRFIWSFGVSVQLFLFFLVAVSLLFPMQGRDLSRYNGPIENPSVFALYVCSIWAVLLGIAEHQLNENRFGIRHAFTGLEMIIAMALMLLSQSLTPMIALGVVTFIWFIRVVKKKKGSHYAAKLSLITGIAVIVTAITMVQVIRCTGIGGDSRLIIKMQSVDISALLSNRNYYWRRYLREMNLLGHSKKPFLWDHRILPHNAFIGMMYWYGVPSVIPYIIMMMMAIEKSWRFANTGVNYSAVPFYCISSFIVMSMADNVEQPFVWLPWIACYLMMAPLLVMPVEEIEALKRTSVDNQIKTTSDNTMNQKCPNNYD